VERKRVHKRDDKKLCEVNGKELIERRSSWSNTYSYTLGTVIEQFHRGTITVKRREWTLGIELPPLRPFPVRWPLVLFFDFLLFHLQSLLSTSAKSK